MHSRKITWACALLLFVSEAFASQAGYTGSSVSKNVNPYAGLVWSWGGNGGYVPDLVLGFNNTRVKLAGETEGEDLSMQIKLKGGFAFDSIKLGYLNGRSDQQGEISIGYRFTTGAPLIGGSLDLPYAKAGVDIDLHGNIVPSLMLDSQGQFAEPQCSRKTGVAGRYLDAQCTKPEPGLI